MYKGDIKMRTKNGWKHNVLAGLALVLMTLIAGYSIKSYLDVPTVYFSAYTGTPMQVCTEGGCYPVYHTDTDVPKRYEAVYIK